MVIGCGQCGGRIADQFALLGKNAKRQRGISIVSNVLAVNTDIADLSGLVHVKPDYKHRILIGSRKTSGHGVGKLNELGAQLAREDGDKILDSIRETRLLQDTDAFLLVAGASGGTGSGAIAVLTKMIKERFVDKPVYNMIVLPFNYEEVTEERTIYNVGTCLKSAYGVADAVILADNQRYVRDASSISDNFNKINYRFVEPFYNILSAGEETTPRYIGSKVLDAGDIIQTLSGWTVIGHSKIASSFLPFKLDFRGKHAETQKGAQAMEDAIAELSLKCRPEDARRALYLLSANPNKMSIDIIKELSATLRDNAKHAIIRSGDYPRGDNMGVTVIMSEISSPKKVMDYFDRTIRFISLDKRLSEGFNVEDAFGSIPSLLD
ncbi:MULTISPECIES: tubulin/FtsZ family protein [Dehalococcoides]|uniref:Tubulin-like protein CetZ n=2 Tax=Dehalococcoides mccartyi TaxID=61435 RepID=D2BI91_DEHMV|nr:MULTISPECIES: tubulin/FtsZ family protein [Dehalococcoides]ACZ62041.1 FtsZ-like protein [Dehalococcoides mccartyi VS]AHB13710.1 tubulin/FtsZ family protein [Dehalococcoides mccartyi GY50]QYY58840.1 tubulin/FtsZ family protein [Dehalococcoides mccartyi]